MCAVSTVVVVVIAVVMSMSIVVVVTQQEACDPFERRCPIYRIRVRRNMQCTQRCEEGLHK